MKNLKNFVKLNVEDKYKIIRNTGQFLMERDLGSKKLLLYSLEKIFCEVWIINVEGNRSIATDIILFKSKGYLDPYLEEIEIMSLY